MATRQSQNLDLTWQKVIRSLIMTDRRLSGGVVFSCDVSPTRKNIDCDVSLTPKNIDFCSSLFAVCLSLACLR